METRTYRDLRVWPLCRDLRDRVLAISATPTVAGDFKYCHQLRAAASSPCTSIAEGFGRSRPRDFARSLRHARGSLTELSGHLDYGLLLGVIFDEERDELAALAIQASAALTQLIAHLDRDAGLTPGQHGPAP